MRKVLTNFFFLVSLMFGLSALSVHAGCQDIHLQNQFGAFNGTVCISATNLTLTGTAFVVATGKTYTVDATATISGTPGHYTVAGTVTISDGTTTRTFTFSCPGSTTITASTAFVSRSVGWVFAQKPTLPAPAPLPSTSQVD